ncbi:MAG: ROK family protein [Oscillospiraceae bacterium]
MSYRIGVDLGGTNIAAGLVDENNTIVKKISCKTNLPLPREAIEEKIANLCRQLVKETNITFADILWVGIGTPGSVNSKLGIVGFNANFGYYDWHLTDAVQKLLSCKVYAENDANAAAYGEYVAGAAKGASIAVAITLGTGIGAGVIIDGKIFTGFNCAGAEIGHTVIEMDGRHCMCGRSGCWEKYASARALTEDTKAAMQENKDTIMWQIVDGNIDNVNAKTAFEGMRKGDETASKLVDNFVKYVSCGLVNVINIFQPEIICIGGGVSKEGDALLDRLRSYIDKEDYARTSHLRTSICAATLRNDAGIIGAAALGELA